MILKKVLTITNCPVRESLGSGYIIHNTSLCLKNLGYYSEIYSGDDVIVMKWLRDRANRYRVALGMAKKIIGLRKKLNKYEFIFFYGAESFLAILLLKKVFRSNVRIVLHSNGIEEHVYFRFNYFKKYLTINSTFYQLNLQFLFQYAYKLSDYIITLSKYDADFAVDHLHLPSGKVNFIEPAIPEVFLRAPIAEKKKIITYCGTWIERKGVVSITEALPSILKEYPEYQLRIIGTGSDFHPSMVFPQEVMGQVESISFVTDKKQLVDLYSESEIFIFPSFSESFGLVVPEAMACGCATITGPTGFAADLLHLKEAIVLEIPDAASLGSSLRLLINNSPLKQVLSLEGKKRASVLTWSVFQEKLARILSIQKE